MKRVLIELSDEVAAELEQGASSRARQRSAILHTAIRQALGGATEERMEAAYRAQPDDAEPAYLEPAAWLPQESKGCGKKRKP